MKTPKRPTPEKRLGNRENAILEAKQSNFKGKGLTVDKVE